ncbi:MAG: hypothetical protein RLZZ366_2093 [Pseudomonadota bacterium]|jgi:hypothetical protein
MKIPFKTCSFALSLLLSQVCAAKGAQDRYTMADFNRVQKIDVHMHLHDDTTAFMELARKDKFKVLVINVDYADFPPLELQQRVATSLHRAYPQDVAFVATFTVKDFNKPGWADETIRHVDQAIADGAVGIKVWKNIGMDLRDTDGKLVMIDDARFDPVIGHLVQRDIVLLGHQGEPKNCWLPLEKMTVNNDKEYFKEHPQYHMYLHPEMPSYEQQMSARDAMLEKNPGLRFVGVHLASLEWDVDELGRFLDRFPNANVDVAARMGQLQYQSGLDRERVRRFFMRYQDRVMYGSDLAQSSGQSAEEFVRDAHTTWLKDWRYFNTDETMKVPELDSPVHGLALPKGVVDKLFRTNAQRQYPQAWNEIKK